MNGIKKDDKTWNFELYKWNYSIQGTFNRQTSLCSWNIGLHIHLVLWHNNLIVIAHNLNRFHGYFALGEKKGKEKGKWVWQIRINLDQKIG